MVIKDYEWRDTFNAHLLDRLNCLTAKCRTLRVIFPVPLILLLKNAKKNREIDITKMPVKRREMFQY